MIDQPQYETIFVARQPIFDTEGKLWGYELLYRDSQMATTATFSDELEATMKVMCNASLCPDADFEKAMVMINFPERSIATNIPYAFPPGRTVVQIPEAIDTADYFIQAIKDLKRDGYVIAVDGYEGKPGSNEICSLADILIIDVLEKTEAEIAVLVADAKEYGALFLAKKVEDHERLNMAMRLGFSYFQGYFFIKPKTVSGRKISSTEAARLNLFEIIEREDPDFKALADNIEADVSISYRLLTYLNSASFSFTQSISSIKQAVVLAGWKQIRTWLRLVILTDFSLGEKTQELAFMSAQRARFFETAARDSGLASKADSLFLLGLFSLLEPMFDVPMPEIIRHLPLAPEINAALCGEENEYTPWLRLVESIDASRWMEVDSIMHAIDLVPDKVADAYQHSIEWANAFFGSMHEGKSD